MKIMGVMVLVIAFLLPQYLGAEEKVKIPVRDTSNPICKQWVEADKADKAKGGKGLPPVSCVVMVPNCPQGSPPDKGTCTLGGFCTGYTACGKEVEGKPGGTPGSPGTTPGGTGSAPTNPLTPPVPPSTSGTINLEPMKVDSGIKGIGDGFNEPPGSGYGSNAPLQGESTGSGWASELLGFLSGLAGLFGPSGSGGSSGGSSGNSYTPPSPQGIRYTPVYVRETPPPQPHTSTRVTAPQFVVPNTFGSFPFEVFPFLNFGFDAQGPTLAELAQHNAPTSDMLRAELYEPAQTQPTIYVPPTMSESIRPTPAAAPQPQLVVGGERGTETSQRPRNDRMQFVQQQPFRISGPNVTFPEPESMLRIALNALPPISSIVSVPNLSFDLARSGTAVLSAIGEFLNDGFDPLATVESREVADTVNADSPYFFGTSEGTLWGELARVSGIMWQSLLSLLD